MSSSSQNSWKIQRTNCGAFRRDHHSDELFDGEKDTTENNKAMGTYLHKVLEVFFLGSKEDFDMEPLEIGEDFDSYALNRLKEITHLLAPKGFVESPLYYQLMNYSWPKFINAEPQAQGSVSFATAGCVK